MRIFFGRDQRLSGKDQRWLAYEFKTLSDYSVCVFVSLKAVDAFGRCQRPVFSLGVLQHLHKITSL